MLMRSFSFDNDELTDDDLSLFEYLVENPEYKSEFSYDILINSLNGKIDKSKTFNLVGYENSIRNNNTLCIYNKAKKEKSYDAPIDDDTNASLSEFIRDEKDLIDNLLEDDFYNEAVNYILSSGIYELLVKSSIFIDLRVTLFRALQGIPDAVRYLKLACDTDNKLKDYIEAILIHGVDEDLKRRLGGYCYGTG